MRALLGAVLSLSCIVGTVNADGPKKVLLLAQGSDGHPAQTHEYEAGLKILHALLAKTSDLHVTVIRADEPWREGPELLANADGAVLFLSEGAKWLSQDAKRLAAFNDLAKRGGGLVCLHWAMGTKDAKNIGPFVDLFGACHGGPDRKYQVVNAQAHVVDRFHPLMRGLGHFKVRDEFYYNLKHKAPSAELLPMLQVEIDGKLETVAWAWGRSDGGRSFGFTGLHFHENWEVPEYRRLVTQGVLWTMRVPLPSDGLK